MRRTLLRLAPILHLTRVTTAFAAVANVWFVILWTRASGGAFEPGTPALRSIPLWLALAGGAVNALGLFAYAAALNDVLDHRRDKTLHPDRPLPSGRLSVEGAIALVVGTFMAAVVGAGVLGVPAVMLTVVVAGAVLFFHAAGKFVPAIGLVVLGLIYAGQMVTPNLSLRFVWPVWLVMTHALLVGAAVHVLSRKVPALSRRAVLTAVLGWAFWTGVMLYAGWRRSGADGSERELWPAWVSGWAAVPPLVLATVFVVLAWRRVRVHGPGPRAAEKIARYGALWLSLYACGWTLGQGYGRELAILGVLTATGFAGMTVLREVYALLEHPTRYRR